MTSNLCRASGRAPRVFEQNICSKIFHATNGIRTHVVTSLRNNKDSWHSALRENRSKAAEISGTAMICTRKPNAATGRPGLKRTIAGQSRWRHSFQRRSGHTIRSDGAFYRDFCLARIHRYPVLVSNNFALVRSFSCSARIPGNAYMSTSLRFMAFNSLLDTLLSAPTHFVSKRTLTLSYVHDPGLLSADQGSVSDDISQGSESLLLSWADVVLHFAGDIQVS